MAFEEIKEHTEEIQKEAQAYIENSVAYYKLWSFKVVMKSTTMIFKFSLIAISLLMFLFFSSIAGAFVIANALGSYALGFLAIGAIYLVITLALLFLVKNKVVEGSILEKFSEIFFND